MGVAGDIVRGVGELIWPRTCHICGEPLNAHSHYICTGCMAALPYVPRSHSGGAPTGIEERLVSMLSMVHGGSWLYYGHEMSSAPLLQAIKYRGCRRLAVWLGRNMATEMVSSGLFDGVQALLPVPLSPLRYLRRGYNQSELLARGVSHITGIPVMTDALHGHFHTSQTRLHRQLRISNASGRYSARAAHPLFSDKGVNHLMLIDDVCTTGTTLLSVAAAITAVRPDMRLSVLTLALAL